MPVDAMAGANVTFLGAGVEQRKFLNICCRDTGNVSDGVDVIIGQTLFKKLFPAARLFFEEGLVLQSALNNHLHHAERQRTIGARPRLQVPVGEPGGTGLARINGDGVFARLKYESGVHRVQRVPVTESGGRIHTSAATVAVLPEAEDVDIKIDANDLRIDTMRSSGAGGQHVNTTDSAVRITHLPTGVVVECQDERSQHKNKAKALKVLRSRLLDQKIAEQEAERSRQRRAQVGTGDRSAKIRTYNFPQSRVTDHRIKLTVHNLDQVLDGDLNDVIEALRLADQEERLQDDAE